ncbi:hypothetical protein [Acidianus bottle-shaped virus 2 strain ABV2]|uniref:Uncharacterized protein n=1 Tax=Acidianus bottle-shaped virus 2 strain ABV2 TaxID=1732173 RepID=A0A0N9NJE8_9VIRU|nr:hypothetical protein AVU01_gp06 [Acidianus bottle-shaped virus 2 strain ABV2]ALG96754.1 hypothetical protein [Acidianus bottle-shaped virus 2 strain ABV2]
MMIKDLESTLKNLVDSELDNNCIHVSHIISYGSPPSEEMLVRGKLYHMAIENLLQQTFNDAIIEKSYRDTIQNEEICYTPDVYIPSQKLLIEIKSSDRSLAYATKQTSIYKYLLEKNNIPIEQCIMITGDLKVYTLNCDKNFGEQILLTYLRSRLNQNLFKSK